VSETLVESKLLLLYLIEKMNIPITTSQISQFVLEEGILNFFELQQCLAEMVEGKYIDTVKENNNTRYTITDLGVVSLGYFENRIPLHIRNKISKYISENRSQIKKDYETTANYFKDIQTGEYAVKCGIYENNSLLMEINITVVNREQARNICDNWKNNVNQIYDKVLWSLLPASNPKTNAAGFPFIPDTWVSSSKGEQSSYLEQTDPSKDNENKSENAI